MRLKSQGLLEIAKNWRAILAKRNEVAPDLALLSFLVHLSFELRYTSSVAFLLSFMRPVFLTLFLVGRSFLSAVFYVVNTSAPLQIRSPHLKSEDGICEGCEKDNGNKSGSPLATRSNPPRTRWKLKKSRSTFNQNKNSKEYNNRNNKQLL
jgi:hypothetical protein